MTSLQEELAKRRKAWTSSEILTADEAQQLGFGSVRIFLGPGRDAQNLEELRAHGVTHVLNCADDVPNYHEGAYPKLVYKRLDIVDFGSDAGSGRTFGSAIAFCRDACAGAAAGASGSQGSSARPVVRRMTQTTDERTDADDNDAGHGRPSSLTAAEEGSLGQAAAGSDVQVACADSFSRLGVEHSGEPASVLHDSGAGEARAILIHCANGSNRSVTVACAVLMGLLNLSLKDAWAIIKSRRAQALPLQDNQQQLLDFDKKLHKGTEASMTKGDFYKKMY